MILHNLIAWWEVITLLQNLIAWWEVYLSLCSIYKWIIFVWIQLQKGWLCYSSEPVTIVNIFSYSPLTCSESLFFFNSFSPLSMWRWISSILQVRSLFSSLHLSRCLLKCWISFCSKGHKWYIVQWTVSHTINTAWNIICTKCII